MVVVAAVVVVLASSGVPSPLYDVYDHRWGIGTAASAVVFAAYSAGVVLLLAVGPRLVRRTGLRATLGVGLLAVIAASAVFVAADQIAAWRSVGVLVVGRVLQGVATGLVNAAGGASLAALAWARPRAAATAGAAVPSGVALGAVLAGILADRAPAALTTPYIVVALLATMTGVGVLRLPDLGYGEPARASGDRARARNCSPLATATPLTMMTWGAAGVYLALGGSMVSSILLVGGPIVAGVVVLMIQGAGGLTQVLVRTRQPCRIGAIAAPVLVGGSVASVVGMARGSVILFVVAALVTGVGFGLGFSGSIRVAGQGATPTALSRYFLLAYTSMSVAAIGAGLLLETSGPTTTLTWCAAVMCALYLISILTLSVSRRRRG